MRQVRPRGSPDPGSGAGIGQSCCTLIGAPFDFLNMNRGQTAANMQSAVNCLSTRLVAAHGRGLFLLSLLSDYPGVPVQKRHPLVIIQQGCKCFGYQSRESFERNLTLIRIDTDRVTNSRGDQVHNQRSDNKYVMRIGIGP